TRSAWYKRHYGRKWRWYYTRVVYHRRYGRKWRVHFRKWLKRVWKTPSPKRRVLHKVTWYKKTLRSQVALVLHPSGLPSTLRSQVARAL
ncbi:hypothetical protein BOX15_Mlig020758g1, partial [Macrostomum lignano]